MGGHIHFFGGRLIRGFSFMAEALVGGGGVDSNMLEGTLGVFDNGMRDFLRLKDIFFPGVLFLAEASSQFQRCGHVPRDGGGQFSTSDFRICAP